MARAYSSLQHRVVSDRLGIAGLLLLALHACDSPAAPEGVAVDSLAARPIRNANDLTSDRDARSGIVRIQVGGPDLCTAAILKSSKISAETWLITAAHCVQSDAWLEVHYGANLGRSRVVFSPRVYVHPDYEGEGSTPDVALVHINEYIPVLNERSYEYLEFTRPYFSGSMAEISGRDVGVFGARDALRWARGAFDKKDDDKVEIDGGDWRTEDAVVEPGDSGGPWLYTRGGESSSEEYIMDGAVIAVTNGGNRDWGMDSWHAIDVYGTGLSGTNVDAWIRNKTNDGVSRVGDLPFERPSLLQVSRSGTDGWIPLIRTARNAGEVFIGDFGPAGCDMGAPRDDVFLAENGRWWVSWCGSTEWEPIRSSTTEIHDSYGLGFGDFNGDGITDVFRASGGEWKVSYSGRSAWTYVNSSTTEIRDSYGLGFGDFNGDGITDVFRASGGTWKVSYSGTRAWTTIKSSTTELTDSYGLAFGDFNGDGRTDVFRASGGQWKVSYSGTSAWTNLKASTTELTDEYGLVLGYFNNDGKVDVLRGNGSDWKVAYSGTSAWQTIGGSNTASRRLMVGDQNGDDISDVFLVRDHIDCVMPIVGNVCHRFSRFNNTAPRR